MKFARISFPTRDIAVRAYYELAQRGRVVSLPDGQFIVPEPGVAFLQTQAIPHQVHEGLRDYETTDLLGIVILAKEI